MCIERNHPRVSVRRQCQMLSLARSNLYYAPKGESAENLALLGVVAWIGLRLIRKVSVSFRIL